MGVKRQLLHTVRAQGGNGLFLRNDGVHRRVYTAPEDRTQFSQP